MNDLVLLNPSNLKDDKIYMDFNLIEMPLFSQNSKALANIGAIYTIDKKRNIKVEVIPGAGLAIPNEFDQRVYLALVQIAMEFKDNHGLSVVENKVYTTYYEIFTKLKTTKRGDTNQRIFDSIKKLKSTQYHLWNCCYKADSGIVAGLYAASFINDYKIMPKNSDSAITAMNYIGATKSETVLELTLHEFFLHNILNKRGNLVHKYNELISLTDSVARIIYLYCEKNRAWIGKKYYNTDKKMKISAKKLANTIPLAWANNNIPFTVGRIRKAFEFLKKNMMVSDFYEYKGKPLSETWYEVEFCWSRDNKEYILTGRENFTIAEVNEIETTQQADIKIEEIKVIDFSNGNLTQIITNEAIEISNNKIDNDELAMILNPIINKISKPTKEIITKLFNEKGIYFVKCSIEYALLNAKKNFDKYLKDTLLNEWAQLKLFEFSDSKSLQNNINEVKIKSKRDIEKELEHINKNEIEHEYYKLDEINKNKYIRFAIKILNIHATNLSSLLQEDPETQLAMSVYAASNSKYYNRTIELYCHKSLNINLNIFSK